jgi:dynein light chain roadblock-type
MAAGQQTKTNLHPLRPMSAELEHTLALLSSRRSVLGYVLLSRGHPVSIIRHSGVIFEGEQGRKYASVIGKIMESVQGGLEEVYGSDGDSDGVSIFVFFCRNYEFI